MLKILGSNPKIKKSKIKPKSARGLFWQMEQLENAFHFFVSESSKIEPLFLEYDELTAIGAAYKERGPLHILDVLNMLEKLAPDYAGIEVAEDVKLIRKRLSRSEGLTLELLEKPFYFMRDETLKTINFLDFYKEFLKPKIATCQVEEDGGNINVIKKNKNTDPGLRFSRIGNI